MESTHIVLKHAALLLYEQLLRLKQTSISMDNFPITTSDTFQIIVIGGAQFKAFVPKKFNGFNVEFREHTAPHKSTIEHNEQTLTVNFKANSTVYIDVDGAHYPDTPTEVSSNWVTEALEYYKIEDEFGVK